MTIENDIRLSRLDKTKEAATHANEELDWPNLNKYRKDNEKLDYKSLKISNGGMASNAFRELKNKNHNEIQEIQDDLRKYCWLDTYAMYAIYKKLLAIVNN